MSGQQFGRSAISRPIVREPGLEQNDTSVLLQQIETAGFNEGRGGFSTAEAAGGAGAHPRERDAFGFQHAPRLARPPDESLADCRQGLSRDLGSRPTIAELETMVRQLLTKERVLAARKLVAAVPSDRRVDEPLRRLRVVLAEPVVRRTFPAPGKRSGDIDWLRRNAGSYTGKWVALADGELLAADESLAVLRRNLRELAPKIKPFLHRL